MGQLWQTKQSIYEGNIAPSHQIGFIYAASGFSAARTCFSFGLFAFTCPPFHGIHSLFLHSLLIARHSVLPCALQKHRFIELYLAPHTLHLTLHQQLFLHINHGLYQHHLAPRRFHSRRAPKGAQPEGSDRLSENPYTSFVARASPAAKSIGSILHIDASLFSFFFRRIRVLLFGSQSFRPLDILRLLLLLSCTWSRSRLLLIVSTAKTFALV